MQGHGVTSMNTRIFSKTALGTSQLANNTHPVCRLKCRSAALKILESSVCTAFWLIFRSFCISSVCKTDGQVRLNLPHSTELRGWQLLIWSKINSPGSPLPGDYATTCPYPDPDNSRLHSQILFLRIQFNIILLLSLFFFKWSPKQAQ
jgi:hypothetical protein